MMRRWAGRLPLLAGLAFLYLPMLVLVVYSFNESRLVTVWAGFSTKWYGELLRDRQILDGIWLSLRVAVLAATAATVLGTLAGLTLARFGAFRGRSVFGAAEKRRRCPAARCVGQGRRDRRLRQTPALSGCR